MTAVRSGIDVLVESPWPVAGRRIGLITNGSGVTSAGVPTWKALRNVPNVRLVRLFGPEHGLEGGAIYMEAVRSAIHAPSGPAGRLAVRHERREPQAAPRGLRRSRGDRLRRRGRGRAVLHLHLDDAPRDGGVRRLAAALRRVRPSEPDRRRRRGRAPVVRLPDLRRAPPDSRPARHDGGGARAVVRRRAPARPRSRRLSGRGLGARHRVLRDGPSVGSAVAQHPDRRHGARVSRHVPPRGDERLGGPRNDAPVRDLRRALARPVRADGRAERPRASGRLVHPDAFPPDVRQARGRPVRRRPPARRRSGRRSARSRPACAIVETVAPAGAPGLPLAERDLRVRRPARDRPADRLGSLPRRARRRREPARRDRAPLRRRVDVPRPPRAVPPVSRPAAGHRRVRRSARLGEDVGHRRAHSAPEGARPASSAR